MEKKKVLFVCEHNSARSQMAEAYLNRFGGDRFFAESAGLKPGILNSFVVKLMKEEGIDISSNKTKSVFDFFKAGKTYDYVVTVCDKGSERCPLFPGKVVRLHWSFPDPSKVEGTEEKKLEKIRKIRDDIKRKVLDFIETME